MMRSFLVCGVLLALLGMTGCASAPRQGSEMLERDHNGSRYSVWSPEGYDLGRSWPVIVFLHGKGECGTDGRRQTDVGLGPALRREPGRWPFVVVFPQKADQESAWEDHAGMVMAELDAVRREFRIDPERVYLTGLSQGGHGTWAIAAMDPPAWAAIAPVCGYGDAELGAKVSTLPIWAFHGGLDDVVLPEHSVILVEAAKAEQRGADGTAARLTVYPEANHNSWDRAYAEEELPGWFLRFRRKAE